MSTTSTSTISPIIVASISSSSATDPFVEFEQAFYNSYVQDDSTPEDLVLAQETADAGAQLAKQIFEPRLVQLNAELALLQKEVSALKLAPRPTVAPTVSAGVPRAPGMSVPNPAATHANIAVPATSKEFNSWSTFQKDQAHQKTPEYVAAPDKSKFCQELYKKLYPTLEDKQRYFKENVLRIMEIEGKLPVAAAVPATAGGAAAKKTGGANGYTTFSKAWYAMPENKGKGLQAAAVGAAWKALPKDQQAAWKAQAVQNKAMQA
jgi:hypothetical protein